MQKEKLGKTADAPTKKAWLEGMKSLLPYTHLGWVLVGTMLVCFAIGYGLDAWLGLSPLFTIAFSVAGIVVGLIQLLRQATEMFRKMGK
ncbi:MAG: AtpZ/AtpI family protein [Bacteroidota bacterium]|nr:AtpZ/AtpI family protein [Bacteroidota bacterium]